MGKKKQVSEMKAVCTFHILVCILMIMTMPLQHPQAHNSTDIYPLFLPKHTLYWDKNVVAVLYGLLLSVSFSLKIMAEYGTNSDSFHDIVPDVKQ